MKITGVGLMLSAIVMGGLFAVYPLFSTFFAGRSLVALYAVIFSLLAVAMSSTVGDTSKEISGFSMLMGFTSGATMYAAMPLSVPEHAAFASALFVGVVLTTAYSGLKGK
jgi:ABC-type multidrug transport system permease subunit